MAQRVKISTLRTGETCCVGGVVEMEGTPLVGPITSRSCVFYDVVVEELKQGLWKQRLRETHGTNFAVRDDTGRVLVRVANAEYKVSNIENEVSGPRDDRHAEQLRQFLDGRDLAWLLGARRRVRFREIGLETGTSVAVCGVVTSEVDRRPGDRVNDYRTTFRRLVLMAGDGCGLSVTD